MLKKEPIKPLLKWPGGKRQEISRPDIKALLPDSIDNFYEPFLGGGACYFATNFKKAFVNDLCGDLINLYNCIKTQDATFYETIQAFTDLWSPIKSSVSSDLVPIYRNNSSLGDLLANKISSSVSYLPTLKNTVNYPGLKSGAWKEIVDQ